VAAQRRGPMDHDQDRISASDMHLTSSPATSI